MSLIFNEMELVDLIGKRLQEDMLKAAEPCIQQALKDAEAEMRRSLAAFVVGYIESSYSVERFGQDLRIIVKMGKDHPHD